MTRATTIIVFAGPTISADAARAVCDAHVWPPAALGDVYRAAKLGPKAIGLIDGFFEGVPSVWHKEILWALSQGVAVFGAASMGALRAAELHPFGMRGVGRIFEAYRDGALEDDDEVAVQYGPAELGYPALSNAMVGIRETLQAAASFRLLSTSDSERLIEHAKRLPFGQRRWAAVVEEAENSIGASEARALKDWLPTGGIDPKREDALAMLNAMMAFVERDETAEAPAFAFEHTVMWEKAVRTFDESETALRAEDADVLDELRLRPELYLSVKRRALAAHLATVDVGKRMKPVERSALVEAAAAFRTERGLFSRASLDRWLADNGLSESDLEALVEREARLTQLANNGGNALARCLVDQLRLDGDYAALLARARAKRAAAPATRTNQHDRSPLELRQWWFANILGRPYPDDYSSFAEALDCSSPRALDDVIASEFAYLRSTGEQDR
ncbi:MAG: TfuA-like protein [Pseudomonadota bacterium]